jgi:hypothetical protein
MILAFKICVGQNPIGKCFWRKFIHFSHFLILVKIQNFLNNASCASDLIQYKHIHLAMGCITISGILNYLSHVKGLNI